MKEYKTQHLFTQARANILAATPRPLPRQPIPQPWSRRTVGGLSFECPYDFEPVRDDRDKLPPEARQFVQRADAYRVQA